MMPCTCCLSQSNVHKIAKSQVADFLSFFFLLLSVALGVCSQQRSLSPELVAAAGGVGALRESHRASHAGNIHTRSHKSIHHIQTGICAHHIEVRESREMAALLLQAPEPGAEGSSLFCSELSFQNGCDCRKFSESLRGFSGRLT